MSAAAPPATTPIDDWFTRRGWAPFPFQREAWEACLAGQDGLVHAPTGMGKTLAVLLGPLAGAIARGDTAGGGARLLWITPMRALASDTLAAIREPLADLLPNWRAEARTGDTSSSVKARQRERLPEVLVTTPESLSLLLSWPASREALAGVCAVVVDEWHELLGSKRGVQTELCLARLRRWAPGLRIWGLSATLGNLQEALAVLLGPGRSGRLVEGRHPKDIRIETLLPESMERFPWSGHLGLNLLDGVLARVAGAASTIVFTNTRSQAELWFQAISEARPDWPVALHHGSLDRDVRAAVETDLAAGRLRCVVSTSSLDLGVDFSPVEQVIQIGSPKGIARLLQRAGRSGHQPGAVSRILGVPGNAFELIEFSAARHAADNRRIEPRQPLRGCLDLLAQHLVTLALSGDARVDEVRAEIATTHAFAQLEEASWQWVLDFLARGGPALRAYPDYARVVVHEGRLRPVADRTGRQHRMAIGTITSDAAVTVRFARGGTLGTVEESFAARLKPGDRFLFAGRPLECLRLRDNVLTVRAAAGRATVVPRWMGGRMPLSTLLADLVRLRLDEARRGVYTDAEMAAVRPVLEAQRQLSIIPAPDELLVELVATREGRHAFVYTFAGRLANEGLAALVAWRIARESPRTITTMANDHGFELLSRHPFPNQPGPWRRWLDPENLLDDILSCLNGTELARRRFRDVARVAGLVLQGFPGARRTSRQLQSSAGLLFDVLNQFDPDNMLLAQARREVLEEQLEYRRLDATLRAAQSMDLILREPPRLTPLAFPLWADRLREQVSTEAWLDRVHAMVASIEGTLAR